MIEGVRLCMFFVTVVSGIKMTSIKNVDGEDMMGMIGPTVDPVEACKAFVVGNPDKKEFYSPNYPDHYPNHTDCIRVLEAQPGHVLKLDFRDYFNLEPSEGCHYDYLEVRDGGHGYSEQIGLYCGYGFPPELTSSTKYLWVRFHSDENIEYRGFRAVYDEIPKPHQETETPDMEECRLEMSGIEGVVNRSDISPDHEKLAKDHQLPLDCMWIIRVQEGWRIQLDFKKFTLAVPNDCESNFVDVFAERTDLPSRLNNFCGSIAEMVMSPGNTLQIRFLAQPQALGSNFEALYTAFRDKPKGESCGEGEYDCEDGNCISAELKCNGRINCRFRWDEDVNECTAKQGILSTILSAEHMIIILIVFFLILTGMCFAFLFNCFKKLIRDHRTIQEHMRMSREMRLEQLGGKKSVTSSVATVLDERTAGGRPSTPGAGGRRPGSGVVPGLGADCYVPAARQGGVLPMTADDEDPEEPEMVDSQCQTRESLFRPSPPPPPPPPPPLPTPHLGFTTFGYSSDSSTGPAEPRATSMESTKSAPDVIMTH